MVWLGGCNFLPPAGLRLWRDLDAVDLVLVDLVLASAACVLPNASLSFVQGSAKSHDPLGLAPEDWPGGPGAAASRAHRFPPGDPSVSPQGQDRPPRIQELLPLSLSPPSGSFCRFRLGPSGPRGPLPTLLGALLVTRIPHHGEGLWGVPADVTSHQHGPHPCPPSACRSALGMGRDQGHCPGSCPGGWRRGRGFQAQGLCTVGPWGPGAGGTEARQR